MVLTIVFSTSFRKCMNFVILFFFLVIALNFSYFLVFSYFGNFFIFYKHLLKLISSKVKNLPVNFLITDRSHIIILIYLLLFFIKKFFR